MRLARSVAMYVLGVSGWLLGAGIGAVPAAASACPAGSQCAPDSLSVSSGATLLATASGTLTASDFSLNWQENVYRDSNEYCNGCLTWIVKVANQQGSTDAVERVTVGSFAGFQADIGVDSANSAPDLSNSGTQQPSQVGRSSNSATLAWYFSGNNELQPGGAAVLLEVETNATSYTVGGISAENTGAAQASAFQPAGPAPNVPETPWVPALGLMGGVAAGGFAVRRRAAAPPKP